MAIQSKSTAREFGCSGSTPPKARRLALSKARHGRADGALLSLFRTRSRTGRWSARRETGINMGAPSPFASLAARTLTHGWFRKVGRSLFADFPMTTSHKSGRPQMQSAECGPAILIGLGTGGATMLARRHRLDPKVSALRREPNLLPRLRLLDQRCVTSTFVTLFVRRS